MLFKIDYTARGRGEESVGSKWVNFAADRTQAVKRFMGWFYATNPDHRVRLENVTEVEIIGDMSGVEAIDCATQEGTEKV